jgi:PAS domain S-box-containing protein
VTHERIPLDLSTLYRAAFEQIADYALILLDSAGTIVGWNQGVQKVLGWPREEFLGRPIAVIFPPEQVEDGTPQELLAQACASGSRANDGWLLKKDGSRFWAAGRTTPILDAGLLAGFVVLLHDATALRHEAAELRHRVAEFETLLDVIPVGIGIARDPEARDIRVNRAFATILRLSPQANASLSAPEGERPNHFKVLRDGRELLPHELPLQQAAMERRSIRGVELDIVFDSGDRARLLEYASPLFDDHGAVRGSVGAFVDLTERAAEQREAALTRERLLDAERAAREEAERASRSKDEFLAGLSHELRTPLNAILGWAHILRKTSPGPAQTQQALSVIERNARLQTSLIDDLLDMSRILSGKTRLDTQRVAISAVVDAAVQSIRPSADAKGIVVEWAGEAAPSMVLGDPVRLQQVVWNLLSNAVKFTPNDGRVEIALCTTGDRVELTVTDTGIGISADFLPCVFDRFRQADGSPRRRFSGLGIGLSIAKDLVELHGGSVLAQSPGENLGATFTVWLPVAGEDRGAAPAAEPPIHETNAPSRPAFPSLAGVSVLVVEDDNDSRALIAAILRASGSDVTCVATAAAALEELTRMTPHVIVSDIGLPEQDGYELIRAIREGSGPAQAVPALALTAYVRADDRRRAVAAGFQLHMSKPVQPSELCGAVAALANRL